MKIKINAPSRMDAYKSVRKVLPPPTKAFGVSKGRGGYDRKRERCDLRKEFA